MATSVVVKDKNRPKRKLALVIGISKYEDGQDLPNAENDAKCIASALKDIGFHVHENQPMINATYKQLKHVIIDFEISIQKEDMVVFYFAGHGKQWEV